MQTGVHMGTLYRCKHTHDSQEVISLLQVSGKDTEPSHPDGCGKAVKENVGLGVLF